ncbi:hypothetical protein QF019_002208 [Pseudomonas frederiksbergensis]
MNGQRVWLITGAANGLGGHCQGRAGRMESRGRR